MCYLGVGSNVTLSLKDIVTIWLEYWIIELAAPLHDWSWVAFHIRQSVAVHYEGGKNGLVIYHNCAASSKALDDLN